MFRKKLIILALLFSIILLGAWLRFYKLEEIPNGLYVDEAIIGYNAYSVAKTGADEFGQRFPIFLRSVSAYSSPLYMYFTVPIVHLLGLEIFSVRLLSALSGTLSIALVYLLLVKLNIFKNYFYPLLASLIFATSPWSILFSRDAFESNFALPILLSGIYFLLMARERRFWLYPAALLLALSTYAYQSERILANLIYLLFLIEQRLTPKKILKDKDILIPSLLLFTLQLPQLILAFQPAFSKRAAGLFYEEAVRLQGDKLSSYLFFLAKPLALAREFLAQYTVYLSPRNLFFEPDGDLQRAYPELSTLFPWMVIPYVLGVYILLTRIREKGIQVIVALMLLSPIPAALTKEPFSTLRAFPLIFPVVATITLGIEFFFKRFKILALVLCLPLIIFSGLLFWRSHFVLFPNERAKTWSYGYKQLAEIIAQNRDVHYIIDQSRTQPSYILLAFYLKYPPEKLQEAADPDVKKNYYTNTVFSDKYKFANLETRYIVWEQDIFREQILVGDSLAVSPDQAKEHFLEKVFEIKGPMHDIIFQGYKTNPKKKCMANPTNPLCQSVK